MPATSSEAKMRTGQADGASLARIFLVGILSLKGVVLVVLALNSRLVMDEFVHFGQSNYLFNGIYTDSWPGKAVGYAVAYKLAHWLAWDAVSALLMGRTEAALFALATVAMIYAIARRLGESRLRALILAIVLLAFSNYIERSFRIRSEPVALLFATAALLVMVKPPPETLRRVFFAGVLSGLAFICTQKSVYFNFSLGAGLVIDRWARREFAAGLRDGAILIAGWFAVVVAYCLVFGGTRALAVAQDVFIGPSFVALHAHEVYADLGHYTAQTLLRNLPLYFACMLGLLLTLARFGSLPRRVRIAAVFSLLITALVFRHNQPWPYVFTMALPFLSLWPLALYDRLQPRPLLSRLAQLSAVVVLAVSFGRNVHYLKHDNRLELYVVRQAEALLRPDQTYFDGTGMVPTRRDVPRVWLDAPAVLRTLDEGQESELFRALERKLPDLIITSYRTDALAKLLAPLIVQSYVEVAPYILIPGSRLSTEAETLFRVPVDGEYDLYLDGAPAPLRLATVDGAEMTFPAWLARGEYRVKLAGGDGDYRILPAGLPQLLPAFPSDRTLFAEVYTY